MTKANELAVAAASLANYQRACFTAKACGDSSWIDTEHLDFLHDDVERLKSECSETEIEQAKEITNAPI